MQKESRIGVYTGSFDPITLGHLNVIERSSHIVDKLIVGVGINPEKNPMFTPDERVELVAAATRQLPAVEVRLFTGLAVSFVRECGAKLMLRGVRSLSDIEHEFTMTLANRKLDPGIETVWITADDQYSHISSSLIKQIAEVADMHHLRLFVPEVVALAMREKLGRD